MTPFSLLRSQVKEIIVIMQSNFQFPLVCSHERIIAKVFIFTISTEQERVLNLKGRQEKIALQIRGS